MGCQYFFMARVLLIKSSFEEKIHRLITPPLGLMYIASTLIQKGGHDVEIIDLRLKFEKTHKILDKIKKYRPDIIGFSAFNQESKYVHDLAGLIKNSSINPKMIVVGGPYATSTPKDVLKDKNIDYVVIGEGEQNILRMANAIEQKKQFILSPS